MCAQRVTASIFGNNLNFISPSHHVRRAFDATCHNCHKHVNAYSSSFPLPPRLDSSLFCLSASRKPSLVPTMAYSNQNQPIQPFVSDYNDSWNWSAFNSSFDSSSRLYTMEGSSSGIQTSSNQMHPSLAGSGSDSWQGATSSLQAITSASHFDLVAANNQAYVNLLDAHNKLFEQHRLLQISFSQQNSPSQPVSPVILNTSLPSSAVSTSSSSLFPVAPGALVLEEPKDYPYVCFWTRGDYKISEPKNKVTMMNSVSGKRGGSRAAKDINVMHQYLEKSDGSVVSGREASAIRKTQTTIWHQIKKISPGELPETWGEAPLVVVNYHRAEMYAAYPLLRLCRDHWKVNLLATTAYSSWHTKNVKNKGKGAKKGKRKAADSDDNDNDSNGDVSNEDDLELDVSDNMNIDTSTSTSASASASTSTSSAASTSVSSPAPSAIALKKRKKSFTPSTQPKKQKTAAASNSFPSSNLTQLAAFTPNPTSSSSLSPSEPSSGQDTIPSHDPPASHDPPVPPFESSPSTPTNSNDAGVHPAPNSANANAHSTPHPANIDNNVAITAPIPVDGNAHIPAPPANINANIGGSSDHTSANTDGAAGKPIKFVNLLDAQFGPASGPTARSEAAAAATSTKTAKQAKKRLGTSSTPANLFYADYLKDHSPVTPKEFDKIWAELSPEARAKWQSRSTELSTAKKASKAQAAAAASAVSQT
ncbi:hypothetical protein DFH08DRAFT_940853 [Mycena albidolilacea]|uniref:Uncharacterized protein n=1 Tax=Mycena albidolilacea TaxID=1033008 RepID=A0AAD6ZKP1_9AGAR|nr:hypothetical protein DFH08DRAFT_940853 [Mycena albidolilacea]